MLYLPSQNLVECLASYRYRSYYIIASAVSCACAMQDNSFVTTPSQYNVKRSLPKAKDDLFLHIHLSSSYAVY